MIASRPWLALAVTVLLVSRPPLSGLTPGHSPLVRAPSRAPGVLAVVEEGTAPAAGWSLASVAAPGPSRTLFLGGVDGRVYRIEPDNLPGAPQQSYDCGGLPTAIGFLDVDGVGAPEVLVAVASEVPSIQILSAADLTQVDTIHPAPSSLDGKMAFLGLDGVVLPGSGFPAGPWIAACGGDQRIYLTYYDPGGSQTFVLDPIGRAYTDGVPISQNGAVNPMLRVAIGDLDGDGARDDLAGVCASHLFVYLDVPAVLASGDPDRYTGVRALSALAGSGSAAARNRSLCLRDLDRPTDGRDEILVGGGAGAFAYDCLPHPGGEGCTIDPRWSACPTLILSTGVLAYEDAFLVDKPGNLSKRERALFHDLTVAEVVPDSPGPEVVMVTTANRDETGTVSVLSRQGKILYHSRDPNAGRPTFPITRIAPVGNDAGPHDVMGVTGMRVKKLLRFSISGTPVSPDLSNRVEQNLDTILDDILNHSPDPVESSVTQENFKFVFRASVRDEASFQALAAFFDGLSVTSNPDDSTGQPNVRFQLLLSQSPTETGDDGPILEKAGWCLGAGLEFYVTAIHGGQPRLNDLAGTLETLRLDYAPAYRGPSVAESGGTFCRNLPVGSPGTWAAFVANLGILLDNARATVDGRLILNETGFFFDLVVPNDPAPGSGDPSMETLFATGGDRIVSMQKSNHLEHPATALGGAQGIWQSGAGAAWGLNGKMAETCQWSDGAFMGVQPEDWCPRMEVAALANGATYFLGLAGAEGLFTAGRHEHFVERDASTGTFDWTQNRRHKRIALELMMRGIVRPVPQEKILTAQGPIFSVETNQTIQDISGDPESLGLLVSERVDNLWAGGLGGLSALLPPSADNVEHVLTASDDAIRMLAAGSTARPVAGGIRLVPSFLVPTGGPWTTIPTDGYRINGNLPGDEIGNVETAFDSFAAGLPFTATGVRLIIQEWTAGASYQLFLIDPRLWGDMDSDLTSNLTLTDSSKVIVSCKDAITGGTLTVSGGTDVSVDILAGTFRILNVTLGTAGG